MTASGRRRARHLAGQHIDRYFLVFRLGSETVDAGQVDERDFFAVRIAHIAGVVFNGDAGKIADLLAQLGQAIEECGLAGIGRADDSDGAIRGAERFVPGLGDRMAAHRGRAHALVSERGSAKQLHMNVAGEIAAHGNFGSVHAVHAGIATGAAAQHLHYQAGNETQVHEMFGNGRGNFQFGENGALADPQIGQGVRLVSWVCGLRRPNMKLKIIFNSKLYSNPSGPHGNDESHTRL